jgi:hypothetical protein
VNLLCVLLAAQQQQVTAWPQRLLLTGAVVAVTALAIWGMWRSWRARAGVDLPVRTAPEDFSAELQVAGRYLGTAPASDWMQRVVANGMGSPGNAIANLAGPGVLLTREGEPDLFLAADQISGADLGRGVAGQVAEKDGLVLWFWQTGDTALQTGFRPDAPEDVARLLGASRRFTTEEGT